ncbi:MAG: methyltransferase domain-containing protein [Betaproteobacteria bacterium]|nr:methyltransferase domain-containing protein [Betaproteobacteria bacterium]
MNRIALLPALLLASFVHHDIVAATGGTKTKTVDAEAKMFTMSAGYERFMGRWSRILAPAFVAFAGVKDGDRVLDVGTGTGALASALEAVVKSGEVVGIDPSEGFISYAKKNAKSGRSRFEIGDAQALQFKDGSFDQTMALLVMNFIPDHNKAIAEMRRVTRPDGVVSACVWDYNAGMQMLRFFWDEVVALDPAMAPKDERHMKLSREGQLAELWKKAGLMNVQEKPLVIDQAYTSFNDYWEPFLKGAGPGGAYVVSLSEDRRQQLEDRIRKRLLGDRGDGAFVLKVQAWCVRGEVPKSARS